MPKVSVCVPIYGVEKYIERCARSLFEQTLEDMEFVFVDDCTKDNSIAVLESVIRDYPNRKNQIKIIHHEYNKGLSHARETGINNAIGDYIAHCDSDDWVDRNMYRDLYEKAIDGDYDVVKGGHLSTDGNRVLEEHWVYTENGLTNPNDVIRYLLMMKQWNTIWSCLVKRDIYLDNRISFTDNSMLEDCYVMCQIFLYANKVGFLNKLYYYYYQNPGSIIHKADNNASVKRSQQAETNIRDILYFIHKKYGNKFDKEESALLFIPRMLLIPIMNKYTNYKYWNVTTPGINFKILTSRYIPFIYKLWYIEVLLRLRPIRYVFKYE